VSSRRVWWSLFSNDDYHDDNQHYHYHKTTTNVTPMTTTTTVTTTTTTTTTTSAPVVNQDHATATTTSTQISTTSEPRPQSRSDFQEEEQLTAQLAHVLSLALTSRRRNSWPPSCMAHVLSLALTSRKRNSWRPSWPVCPSCSVRTSHTRPTKWFSIASLLAAPASQGQSGRRVNDTVNS